MKPQYYRGMGRALLATWALAMLLLAAISQPWLYPLVHAQAGTDSAEIAPRKAWGPFGSTFGDVQIDVNRTGIAVRVEIPREFLAGVIGYENDTHFIETDIRNDYYYISVVDESTRWSYDWNRQNSTAPCFTPNFSFRDPNAPWCIEIWNYLNGTFLNFTAPRFVRFHELRAPSVVGVYNFTLFVANKTNNLGFPDFVNAWNRTLYVPVSMKPNPASIWGHITDCQSGEIITAKGIVYAKDNTGTIVARAFVNQTTGFYNLTGLARGASYTLYASAGVFRDSTGMVQTYSLTSYNLDGQCNGSPVAVTAPTLNLFIRLKRSPQITGIIRFHDARDVSNPYSQIRPLTEPSYPWLVAAGLQVLNVTAEAMDLNTGVVFRNQTNSHTLSNDPITDQLKIITGVGIKYVGLDPYGTEFAGLNPLHTYRLRIWVTGYSLRPVADFVLPSQGAVNVGDAWMDSDGVIWGEIRFVRDESLAPETPYEADLQIGTGDFFAGNMIIEARDSKGTVRGLTIINGTYANGTTRNEIRFNPTLQFYVVGFSEFHNRTWAGIWNERDEGLRVSGTDIFTLTVMIRGYEQVGETTVDFGGRGYRYPAEPVSVYMRRGGAIEVGVYSYNNRFGTRALQAPQPWGFLNFSIPIRARVYFYGPPCPQNVCGYVERLMIFGVPNGVQSNFFEVLFTGQNWSLRDIWFYSAIPTHISSETYTVKAFTLGYVQQRDTSVIGAPGAAPTHSFVALLIGNGVGITGSLFIAPRSGSTTFTATPEHDHVIAETRLDTTLWGATPANLTTGFGTLILPIYGFGGMTLNNRFLGQGHFFYVDPSGSRHFDYGIDVGNYTSQIPEFGFTKHFMQLPAPLYVSFGDLDYFTDRSADLIEMGEIWHGNENLVRTEVDLELFPLSWVRIEAYNGSISGACSPNLYGSIDRCVPSMDGEYDRVGALFLPGGTTYTITLQDLTGYCSSTSVTMYVPWNSKLPLATDAQLTCEDPPPSPSNSYETTLSSSLPVAVISPARRRETDKRWNFSSGTRQFLGHLLLIL